jgi:hypothetical protein
VSQVEGFGDDVMEIEVTRPLMSRATFCGDGERPPTSGEHVD